MIKINTKKIKIMIFALLTLLIIIAYVFTIKGSKKNNIKTKTTPMTKYAPNNLINKDIIDKNKVIKKEAEEKISYLDKSTTAKNIEENNTKKIDVSSKNSKNIIKSLNTKPNAKNDKTNNSSKAIKQINKSLSVLDNNQNSKNNFIIENQKVDNDSYFLTENDIAPGTIIPITLITGLNSDLPGEIIGQVNTNIYDTLTHRNLLIPKGSKVLAKYDSNISWGQNRILISWNTLIREDGFVLYMPGFQGVDNSGFNGYTGKVNNYYSEILKYSALSSLINIGNTSLNNITEDNTLNMLLESITDTSSNIANGLNQKAINRQPTININPGRSEKILVNRKITLPLMSRLK